MFYLLVFYKDFFFASLSLGDIGFYFFSFALLLLDFNIKAMQALKNKLEKFFFFFYGLE